MSLTDGGIADLARQVADLLGPDVSVRIRPAANDDPYRWGGHGWVITIGDSADIWIPIESSPEEALAKLREGVQPGGAAE